MTHFTASNLVDAATTVIGLNFAQEIGKLGEVLSQPRGEALLLSFRCLTTAYVISMYALSQEEKIRWGKYATNKVMRLTVPAIYTVSAWNLFQIGIEIFGR